jgi:polar amino acid transport system permease protein
VIGPALDARFCTNAGFGVEFSDASCFQQLKPGYREANPTMSARSSTRRGPSFQVGVTDRLAEFPWWGLVIILGAVLLIYQFATNQTYKSILESLVVGVRLTVTITLIAYVISLVLGLVTALAQLSNNFVFRNIAMLYVQIVRGIPAIVLIFYTALVFVPAAVKMINALGEQLSSAGWLTAENLLTKVSIRDLSFVARGIIALSINYGAFTAEIFRAGIQSIERGQIDAARALGMTESQTFRLVVFPQALRRILPPLGNDFIAMLKESSLVSVLGVNEITHLGKKYAASSFLYPATYNTVAFLYLSITLVLSMGVKWMERRLETE